uniref:Lysosome-associated membrane glycoprotein 5 n=1 Tax=Crassostrea virginica TaxID=6565 RepID=A0A8B8D202_CRAVI|nr:uncharacterized protein LOC111123022 [Crassostrea virginica]
MATAVLHQIIPFSSAGGNNGYSLLDSHYFADGDYFCNNRRQYVGFPIQFLRFQAMCHVILDALLTSTYKMKTDSDSISRQCYCVIGHCTTNLIFESEPSVLFEAKEAYHCKSLDSILLHDDSGKNVGTLFISNVIFHVFDFLNGNLTGKVKKCSIDNTNSTLQPENLTPNEDLTDEIANFVLKNEKGKTCVRLSGEIDIKYQYEKSNGNLTSVKLTVPKTAIVSGYCDDKKSYLVLRYTEGGASRGVAFYLSHVGTSTKLENIETILKLDSAKFPSAKHTNAVVRSYGKIGEQLGSGNSYYGCQHEKQFVGRDFILETRHLQLQASVSNLQEDFSLDRTSCPEDDVKMTATQTFSLKDGNQTCVLLSGALRFSIPYTSRQNSTEQQLVNVPFLQTSMYPETVIPPSVRK